MVISTVLLLRVLCKCLWPVPPGPSCCTPSPGCGTISTLFALMIDNVIVSFRNFLIVLEAAVQEGSIPIFFGLLADKIKIFNTSFRLSSFLFSSFLLLQIGLSRPQAAWCFRDEGCLQEWRHAPSGSGSIPTSKLPWLTLRWVPIAAWYYPNKPN